MFGKQFLVACDACFAWTSTILRLFTLIVTVGNCGLCIRGCLACGSYGARCSNLYWFPSVIKPTLALHLGAPHGAQDPDPMQISVDHFTSTWASWDLDQDLAWLFSACFVEPYAIPHWSVSKIRIPQIRFYYPCGASHNDASAVHYSWDRYDSGSGIIFHKKSIGFPIEVAMLQ